MLRMCQVGHQYVPTLSLTSTVQSMCRIYAI